VTEDQSKIIPINRAIINKLSESLKSMQQEFLSQHKNINATLITCEGFMRPQKINFDGNPVLLVPRYVPMKPDRVFDASSVKHEYIKFRLDGYMSTKDHLIFREVRQ
jgi:hypothetical protein